MYLGNSLDKNSVTVLHEPSYPVSSNNVVTENYAKHNIHVDDLSGSIQKHNFIYALNSKSEYNSHNFVDTIDRTSSETQVIPGKKSQVISCL